MVVLVRCAAERWALFSSNNSGELTAAPRRLLGNRLAIISPTVLLATGTIATQAIGMFRNILIARLLGPEDFGIGAALAMTAAMVEMLSDLGVGRNLSRQAEVDPRERLAAGHAVSVIRGLIGAAVLLLLGPIIAGSMRLSEYAWAFSATAVIPLARGFIHHDYWVAQRTHNFRPYLTIELLPQIVSLAAVVPLTLILRDYTAVLVIMALNALLMLGISHLVASVPYRADRRSRHISEFRSFGWPLLVDGVILFAIYHGERVLVGRYYGDTALGLYSAAYLLTWTPTQLLARIGLGVGIPAFSRTSGLQRAVLSIAWTGRWLTLLGSCGVLLAAMCGSELLTLLFGNRYEPAVTVLVVLASTQLFRCLRIMPTALAIARGNTTIPMVANVLRVIGIGASWNIASRGGSIESALIAGTLAEAGATLWQLAQQRRFHGIPFVPTAVCTVCAAAICTLAVLIVMRYHQAVPLEWRASAFVVMALVVGTTLSRRRSDLSLGLGADA